ncbi:MAG: murein hydrolase activator EnvC family protein [Rhodospirillaceae bacterium]
MTRALHPLLALLLLATSAGATAAQPSKAAANEELQQLRSRIEALKQELATAEESKSEAADALKASERAISDANRKLAELNEKASDGNRQLAELRRLSEQNADAVRRQQALQADWLYQRYVSGVPEPLKLLLSGENPARIGRELYYYGRVLEARGEHIASLRESLAQLRDLETQTQEKMSELNAIAAEQEAQRKRLEQEKQARAKVLAQISRDIQRQRREIGTLKRDENRLTKLIERLNRIIARTPAPKPPRATAQAPRLKNDRLPAKMTEAGPFETLKGRLALPVRGELVNRYGSPRSDGGLTWRGLFIAAPAGEQVRAVAPGRVVFADWLRGFGNLLIVDHGDGYMSLYGYNETLYKQVGQSIAGGDVVAAVGNSGGSADSGLYFEMRHQGKPFDPLTWVNMR